MEQTESLIAPHGAPFDHHEDEVGEAVNSPDIELAKTLLEEGRPAKALEVAEETLSLIENDKTALTVRVKALTSMRYFEEAHLACDDYIDIHAEDSYGYHMKALLLKASGDTDGAMEQISKAIYFKPQNPEHYSVDADILKDAGMYEEALFSIEDALEIDPDRANDLSLKAKLHMELGEFVSARDSIRQEIRVSGGNWYSNSLHTIALHLNGQNEEALLLTNERLHADPEDFGAHKHKALLLYAEGRLEEGALATYTRFKEHPSLDVYLSLVAYTEMDAFPKGLCDSIRKDVWFKRKNQGGKNLNRFEKRIRRDPEGYLSKEYQKVVDEFAKPFSKQKNGPLP